MELIINDEMQVFFPLNFADYCYSFQFMNKSLKIILNLHNTAVDLALSWDCFQGFDTFEPSVLLILVLNQNMK